MILQLKKDNKMTTFTAIIKIAASITLISGGAALAENKPPVVTPPPFQGGGDASSNSDALAQALSAAFAGAVSGSASSAAQQQAQKQSSRNNNRNNNQSSSSATGGNANASGGNQSVYVDNSNRQRMAANTAAMASIQSTGNTLCDGGGSFSASVQTYGWGVSAANKKGDRFCQLLMTFGPAVAGAYIGEKDNAAARAMVNNGAAIWAKDKKVTVPTGRLICPAYAPTYVEGKGCK